MAMIEQYSFGRMVISGRAYNADLKIINGRVVADWWRKAGHLVEKDDVTDILAAKPQYLIIGKGKPGLMRVSGQLAAELQDLGIELVVEPTASAVESFNRMVAAGRQVAAAFHLSC
jgi:hypothetical protein